MEKKSINPNSVYTTDEVAEILGLDTSTVQRYIRQNKIKAIKIGGKWYRVLGQSLLDFMGSESVIVDSLMFENALVELDLGKEFNHTTLHKSPFYNVTSSVVKRITLESQTRGEMLRKLAEFIREYKK